MTADRLDELNKERDIETGEEIGPKALDEGDFRSNDNFNIPALSRAALMKNVYRIQLGAFKTDLDKNIYANVPDIVAVEFSDGITRYYHGSFKTYEEAASAKIAMLGEGFDDAWVVTFRNGERKNIRDAGATVVNEDAMLNDPDFDPTAVKFRVQIGAFTKELPSDVLQNMVTLDDIIQRKQDGETKYVTGEFETYTEARKLVEELKGKFPGAFVVGDTAGKIVSADKAKSLKQR